MGLSRDMGIVEGACPAKTRIRAEKERRRGRTSVVKEVFDKLNLGPLVRVVEVSEQGLRMRRTVSRGRGRKRGHRAATRTVMSLQESHVPGANAG